MSDTEELNEVEAKAKPAKTVKAKGRKSIVKKAKASKEVKVKKAPKPAVVRDKFGLRKGSARSEAATMYARKSGATLAEVKERVGSIQLNVLTTLAKNGWEVDKDTEKRAGGRPVTRYWIRAAK